VIRKFFIALAALIFLFAAGFYAYGSWTRVHSLDTVGTPPSGNVIGNPEGSLTIVEFVDYTCHYCPILHDRLMQAVANDPDIRIVVRPLPWLGGEAGEIAELAIAAGLQGKDIVLHKALMEAGGVQTYEEARDLAGKAGIDMSRAENDRRLPDIKAHLKDNIDYTTDLGIQTIPALLIGTTVLVSPSDTELPSINRIKMVIAEQR
jgi:protein-disulfide isomerase